MMLFDLIHKNESMQVATATLATPATHGDKPPATVANVASVAVANAQNEKTALSLANRQKLLEYLEAIGETDPEIIEEFLTASGKSANNLAWVLQWTASVKADQKQLCTRLITCGNCRSFEAYHPHGRGAGSCKAGVSPFGVCHWSETAHECNKYLTVRPKYGE